MTFEIVEVQVLLFKDGIFWLFKRAIVFCRYLQKEDVPNQLQVNFW